MKRLALLTIVTAIIAGCTAKKPTVTAVDESSWPVQKRLHKKYYDGLKKCLSTSTAQDPKFVSECLGGQFLLNVSQNKSAADLKINEVRQLSFSETSDVAHTLLLLNAEDSLYLEVDYENCIYCKVKPKSFDLFYRTMGLKSKVISGSGF